MANQDELHKALLEIRAAAKQKVIIDMSNVGSIDLAALGMLATLTTLSPGKDRLTVALRATGRAVRELLDVSGTSDFFALVPAEHP